MIKIDQKCNDTIEEITKYGFSKNTVITLMSLLPILNTRLCLVFLWKILGF